MTVKRLLVALGCLGLLAGAAFLAKETETAADRMATAADKFIASLTAVQRKKALYDFDLLLPIRQRVAQGMPYIGSSAGSNVACPTIKTTKDMPIVQPPSFDALGLIPFQISPHYQDPDPNSTHMGETQEERIIQFLEENPTPVAGLREGAMLRVEQGAIELKGVSGARIFRRGQEPVELKPGEKLNFLVLPST